MNIRMMVMVLGLGIAGQAIADGRGGVWVYQPDGGSYRVENRSYQYDPRSPYPQHKQYPQNNLPPRHQGQLPPQYYERHRSSERPRWNNDRRGDARQLQRWKDERKSGFDRPHRWSGDHSGNVGRRPPIRDGRDYRTHQRHDYNGRHYRR